MNNTTSLADRILAHGKNIVYHFLGYLQFFVALTIAAAIIITLLSIPQQLGVLTDVGSESLIEFLEYVINVIISIELIHVLLHQTLDSIVEVLSLAITRELILQHLHTYEFLIGVIAIAVLFAIRKFLFISEKDKPLMKSEDNAIVIDEEGVHAPVKEKIAASKVTAGLYGYRPAGSNIKKAAAAVASAVKTMPASPDEGNAPAAEDPASAAEDNASASEKNSQAAEVSAPEAEENASAGSAAAEADTAGSSASSQSFREVDTSDAASETSTAEG